MNQQAQNHDEPTGEPPILDDSSEKPQPLIFDDAVQGLHRDHAADAPEPVQSKPESDAPQVVAETDLELALSSSGSAGTEEKIQIPAKPTHVKYKRIAIVLCVLTGIALAIGLAIGLTRPGAISNSSGNGTTPTLPRQLIDNNTALAAAFLENGDRIVLFEDSSDSLRRLLYSASSREWLPSSILPTTVTLRQHTPMSIAVFGSAALLYFIDSNNYLVEMDIGLDAISFSTRNLSLAGNNTMIKASSDCAALSATAFLSEDSAVLNKYVLFRNTSDVTNLLYTTSEANASLPSSNWTDLSDKMLASQPNASFSYPFSSWNSSLTSISSGRKTTGSSSFTAEFYDPEADPRNNLIYTWYNSTGQTFLTSTSSIVTVESAAPLGDVNTTAIQASDYVVVNPENLLGFWINGTTPSFNIVYDSILNAPPPPSNPFVYPHFAVPTSNQGTMENYIYHQLNGSFILEEAYDPGMKMWITTPINVTGLAEAFSEAFSQAFSVSLGSSGAGEQYGAMQNLTRRFGNWSRSLLSQDLLSWTQYSNGFSQYDFPAP